MTMHVPAGEATIMNSLGHFSTGENLAEFSDL